MYGFVFIVIVILIKWGMNLIWVGGFFIVGIVLFSGSLYLFVLMGMKWFGFIILIGGVCFIIGWVILLV